MDQITKLLNRWAKAKKSLARLQNDISEIEAALLSEISKLPCDGDEEGEFFNQREERTLRKIALLCEASGSGYASHSDLVRGTTNISSEMRCSIIDRLISTGKIEKLKGIGDRPGPAPIYYRMLVDLTLKPETKAKELPIEILQQ
jgi:hypothetical protein